MPGDLPEPAENNSDLPEEESASTTVERRREGEPEGTRLDPDVYLDIPIVKVDQIKLDVEDLRARVSLEANVLDLLRLHVGVDAALGRVNLEISGVEAKALLKVRLDNVAAIIHDVLKTIDNNPQILQSLTSGVGEAARGIGAGAGRAVGEIGSETGAALKGTVENVGESAGEAVKQVPETARSVTESAGTAVKGATGPDSAV